jgi:hypothetical protein
MIYEHLLSTCRGALVSGMAAMSDQTPSTEVYSDASDIPLGAKVSYAIVAFIGFFGLVGCLSK